MLLNWLRACIIALITISHLPARAQDLNIRLKNNDERETQTREQLLKLLSSYDLKKWIFTQTVVIESGRRVVPHSHPELTLSTRHLKDDELLLATFIHEQLHWYIASHPSKAGLLEQLKALYPQPRVDFPEGSGDETSTYYHIIICHLEYSALKQLVGELRAFQIISFWQQDHYYWVYKTVLQDYRQLDDLALKHGLIR